MRGNLWVKISILLTLWFVVFYPLYPKLIGAWIYDSDNSHGILVPLISLYMIYHKRDNLRSIEISNSGWGAIILIISMGIYCLSFVGEVLFISRSMIIFSLIGVVLYNLGKGFLKELAFPLLFLLFMIPVPESIQGLVAFPLQLFVTKISAYALQLLSIPAYREGNMIYFAETQLEIAEACSGIRSIVSLTLLGVVLAYFSDKGVARKAVMIASAIPLALCANAMRVFGTGIIAHLYGAKYARGFLHEFSGIAIFFLGFILMFLEYLLVNRPGKKQTQHGKQ